MSLWSPGFHTYIQTSVCLSPPISLIYKLHSHPWQKFSFGTLKFIQFSNSIIKGEPYKTRPGPTAEKCPKPVVSKCSWSLQASAPPQCLWKPHQQDDLTRDDRQSCPLLCLLLPFLILDLTHALTEYWKNRIKCSTMIWNLPYNSDRNS
jgi:hypothetical protein